jgi:hypothetical protein
MAERPLQLIHVAFIYKRGYGKRYLFLRKEESNCYRWYEEGDDTAEHATAVEDPVVEEALRLARRHWKLHGFQTVKCGFRYTLPERDEHGMNALFHQMVASYSSSNGVYFDEELGHNCYVQNSSLEARALWKRELTPSRPSPAHQLPW